MALQSEALLHDNAGQPKPRPVFAANHVSPPSVL